MQRHTFKYSAMKIYYESYLHHSRVREKTKRGKYSWCALKCIKGVLQLRGTVLNTSPQPPKQDSQRILLPLQANTIATHEPQTRRNTILPRLCRQHPHARKAQLVLTATPPHLRLSLQPPSVPAYMGISSSHCLGAMPSDELPATDQARLTCIEGMDGWISPVDPKTKPLLFIAVQVRGHSTRNQIVSTRHLAYIASRCAGVDQEQASMRSVRRTTSFPGSCHGGGRRAWKAQEAGIAVVSP